LNIKSIAFSGLAVAFAVVMSLGLMVEPVQASATVTTQITFAAMARPTEAELNDGTANVGTMSANTGGAFTASGANLVITESAAAQLNAGTLIFNLPSGWEFQDVGTCTVGANAGTQTCVPTLSSSNSVLTWTLAGASNGGATTLTSGSLEVRPRSNTTSAGGSITLDAASTVLAQTTTIGLSAGQVVGTIATPTAYAGDAAPYSINLSMTNGTTPCGTTNPVTTVAATTAADGSGALALCAAVRAASGNPVVGAPVTFTVSTGVVSTGTSKTVVAITNSAGNASTNYRGGGNVAGTDTAIASNTQLNAVGTLNITLTAATGTTASKVQFGPAVNTAIAATVTNVSPGYVSPQFGAQTYLTVTDAAGLGVNNQTVLITTDRGSLVDGSNAACAGVTAKSITAQTATEAQVVGGTNQAGTIAFTVCTNQLDAPGKVTITGQNISTSMANATLTLSNAGRPAKVEATATGSSISAKVTDSAGNNVSDGTPVRFTISANAGAVSTTCTTTTNGSASAVVALIAASGTVIVSTDWNETGAIVPGCSAVAAANQNSQMTVSTGSQSLATSVTVPGGTSSSGTPTTPTTPTTPAAGSVTSGSVPAAGGFGFFVYGGPISGLSAATGCPAGTAAFWATVAGEFVTNVPGTTISAVNAAFNAAFPNGIPAGTALLGKCK